MGKRGVIAPKVGSSSVGVLLATPHDMSPMIPASAWVKAFADPAGDPNVQLRSTGETQTAITDLADMMLQARENVVPQSMLDNLGGLRGHSLIWVAPRHVPVSGEKEGLMFFRGATLAPEQQLVIRVRDLEPMLVVPFGQDVELVVHPQQGSDPRLFLLTLLLNTLRLSFYAQIYLCVVARQRRPAGGKTADRKPESLALDDLATQLNRLTDCTIYYNERAIEFAPDGSAIVPTSDAKLAPASGFKLFSDQAETLKAPPGRFFGGSMKRKT